MAMLTMLDPRRDRHATGLVEDIHVTYPAQGNVQIDRRTGRGPVDIVNIRITLTLGLSVPLMVRESPATNGPKSIAAQPVRVMVPSVEAVPSFDGPCATGCVGLVVHVHTRVAKVIVDDRHCALNAGEILRRRADVNDVGTLAQE